MRAMDGAALEALRKERQTQASHPANTHSFVAGQLHPDLRQHDASFHKAVLFDAAPAAMVLAYKRHF